VIGRRGSSSVRAPKRRRRRSRVSNAVAGLATAIVVLAACWLVFGGPTPWGGGGYKLRAVFTVQTELHLDSPVRIAGVDVGKVTGIHHVQGDSTAALVTMTIAHEGLPIHSDATANIRPRLFLEGNYYVNLQPGTPQAPVLRSGGVLPAAHTSGPVQLDRVLSALNSDARGNLQTLVRPALGGRRRHRRSLSARTHRRAVAQPLPGLLRRRVQGLGDRQPGAAGRRSARPLRSGGGTVGDVHRPGRLRQPSV
jgi:hypothetical protein